MSARLLTPSDYRRMPWKNGGGETIEIAVSPEGSRLDDFDWRLSMAIVARDGPFSTFPGVDRYLSVIAGAGIHLDLAGGSSVTLTQESGPFHFPGDVAVTGRLVEGPITDLNLMLRRQAMRAQVHRIADEDGRSFDFGRGSLLVYAVENSEIVVDGVSIPVHAGCALVIAGLDTAGVSVTSRQAHVVFIEAADQPLSSTSARTT